MFFYIYLVKKENQKVLFFWLPDLVGYYIPYDNKMFVNCSLYS